MKVVILFVASFLFLSCKTTEQASFTNVEWKLVKMKGEDMSSLNPPVTLSFDESQKKVNGFAGCNRFFGAYQSEKSTISISGIGSTKMFCQDNMKVEDGYFQALGTIRSFRLEDDKLFLLTGDEVVLEFRK